MCNIQLLNNNDNIPEYVYLYVVSFYVYVHFIVELFANGEEYSKMLTKLFKWINYGQDYERRIMVPSHKSKRQVILRTITILLKNFNKIQYICIYIVNKLSI